jgi:hypothetical protein
MTAPKSIPPQPAKSEIMFFAIFGNMYLRFNLLSAGFGCQPKSAFLWFRQILVGIEKN